MPAKLDRWIAQGKFRRTRKGLPNRSGQQQLRIWRLPRLIVVLIGCWLLARPTAAAPVKTIRRVLFVNSLGPSYPYTTRINEAIRANLEKSPYQIDLYHEYLETVLFPEASTQKKSREWYIEKYRDRKPDVIIAVGISAIRFMRDSHEKFFPDTPIIFCGGIEEVAVKLKLDSHFAGAWMDPLPEKTLDAALRLQPGTRHVVVVGGVGEADRNTETMVREHIRAYEAGLDFKYLTDLAMPALLDQLRQLPNHTIVLYTTLSQDAAGTRFIDSTQAIPIITGAASAPVFVLADTFVGPGTVGGYVVNFAGQGQAAAQIVMRALQGEKPQDIPIIRGTNVYLFDWRALQRWGFKEGELPPGSIELNRQPTVWRSYKRYILGIIGLFIVETLLILALLWQRASRRKVEQSFSQRLTFETLFSDLSTTFINLPEEQIAPNIEGSLGRIAALLQMDRITLYEFSQDRTELALSFAWSKGGHQDVLALLKTSQMPLWSDRTLHGEVMTTSDASTLPDEASSEKEYLRALGIVSMATVPLEVGGEVFGAITFATKTRRVVWSEDLVQRLKVFAEIFSNALGRKHTEARRRESEERFRLVASTAPVLIWMSGIDKLCTYVNQAWLDFTGRELEAELGNGWAEGVHSEDLQRCMETYYEAFDARQRFTMEYRLRRHDVEYRWILDTGVPRFNADDSFAGYIGSAMDITDHKEAEQALATVSGRLIQAQEEERHRIARELHDDISQRLALVFIDLQRLAAALPKSSHELRNETNKLLKRTSEVSSDIHALSHRLHSSKLEYMGVVAAMAGFCSEMSAQQDVEIDFRHSDVPKSLPRDISLCLFRVLQECVRNAIKYSGVRHFKADLRGVPGAILFTMHDSGAGFNPEAAIKNGGLGLISMRERVSLVKGTISILSKPMIGTEIRVHIPVAQALAASAAQMSLPVAKGEYGTSKKKNLAG